MNDSISDAQIIEEEVGDMTELNKELTDDEKKAMYIAKLKESRMHYSPVKRNGNVTTNQFDVKYKKKRQQKNKQQKKSRRANRG